MNNAATSRSVLGRPSSATRPVRGPAAATTGYRPAKEATTLPLQAQDVDVWRAALDDQPVETVRFMHTLLAPDELQRSHGFYFDRDRRRYVIGRGILRLLLSRYLDQPPPQIGFQYGPNGKPMLARGTKDPSLYFNVAHSEGLALFAFTRAGEIGIDVEAIRELPDWEQVAEAAFSPHELRQLRACPSERRRDEFFRAWTRQEAVLKALGSGLGSPPVTTESAFNVYPLAAGPGFAAAIAASPAAKKPTELFGWNVARTRTSEAGAEKQSPVQTALL